MANTIYPENYSPKLNPFQTEIAIGKIKNKFEEFFKYDLDLIFIKRMFDKSVSENSS